MFFSRFLLIPFLVAAALAGYPAKAAEAAEGVEFFEKNIRPVLAEKCYVCHSSQTMALGELRVDSREAIRKGGTRGSAVAPRSPESSVLLKAISYTDLDLKMPPTGKLSDQEIAAFRAWIEVGAPDPREEAAVPKTAVAEPAGIDFEEGRKYWAFQPVTRPTPPATAGAEWAKTDVDRFILARLEKEGLAPAAAADKRTLLRRVTFDLIGLPPTPEEINAFLADDSADAYRTVVERLLAAPQYGERWARHWLDLVRFGETNGHEFDNDKLDAWRYRDYVIRAFNEDLPYNTFLKEQIAGDLLPEQRLSNDGAYWESPIGSGFFWLWEVLNSPTDSIKSRANQIDNQIDVFGKATVGLTLACARCHDHKFDPIEAQDYYATFGVFHSTQMTETCIDSPRRKAEIAAVVEKLEGMNSDARTRLAPAVREEAGGLRSYLSAAGEFLALDSEKGDAVGPFASSRGLDGATLEKWLATLRYAEKEPSHPLYPFVRLAKAKEPFAQRLAAVREEMADWALKADPAHPIWKEREDEVYEDFSGGFNKWMIAGDAFGQAPRREVAPNQALAGYAGQPLANSFGAGADELVGTLTTHKFTMPTRFVHVRMAGSEADKRDRDKALVRFTVVADDHKSGHAMPSGSEGLDWYTVAMVKERDRTCYLEIVDRGRDSRIAVDRIVFSNSPKPPPIAGTPNHEVLALLSRADLASLEDVAAAYQSLALTAVARTDPEAHALTAALRPAGALDEAGSRLSGLQNLAAARRQAGASLPTSAFAMTSMDVDPANVRIHQRGNHKNLGAEAPRAYLQVIAGEDQPAVKSGSGRLEFAEWTGSEKNPLTARVMANRIWKHHFGYGLARSVDNFGETGDRPTHPELLDYLAGKFVDSGWSIKSLQREIVMSSAYRMDSEASDAAAERDPLNKLLSHMPVRRLEAEAIRDSMLVVAGTLNTESFGPSIAPHISPYQDGRGKPDSGPLDGLGRRSIYIQVRRNFLTPLFLAFDYPQPFSTMGQRGVSAVPSQALILLNNEFVQQQAGRWAQAAMETKSDGGGRIAGMFEKAFGRPPEDWEVEEIRGFLEDQRAVYGGAERDDPRLWTDLAHVLFNSSEFVFVR